MTEYGVGDLVKDKFGRIFIVAKLNCNRDGDIFNVSLSHISGKSVDNFFVNKDGFIKMFPYELTVLKAQGVDNA